MNQLNHAIARRPGPDLAGGLTTSGLGAPDHALMLDQHAAYVHALETAGLAVEVLEPLPGFPDAYFVEDAAVVVPEVAILTRPGAPSRREEPAHIESALAARRPIARIEAPATLDGGDVLIAGRRCLVGVSARTNRAGAEALAAILKPHGYAVVPVEVDDGLHLKSGLNLVGPDTFAATPPFAHLDTLAGSEVIVLATADAYAANSLWVNDTLIVPAGFDRARERFESTGLDIVELDLSEARKMDGGLTCMSVRM